MVAIPDIPKPNKPRTIICNNPECRLFNQAIDPQGDSYFDADQGRTIRFGENCPVCKRPLIHKRDE